MHTLVTHDKLTPSDRARTHVPNVLGVTVHSHRAPPTLIVSQSAPPTLMVLKLTPSHRAPSTLMVLKLTQHNGTRHQATSTTHNSSTWTQQFPTVHNSLQQLRVKHVNITQYCQQFHNQSPKSYKHKTTIPNSSQQLATVPNNYVIACQYYS